MELTAITNAANLDSFNLKIRQWGCLECSCTLCKTYLPSLGCLLGRSSLASWYFVFVQF